MFLASLETTKKEQNILQACSTDHIEKKMSLPCNKIETTEFMEREHTDFCSFGEHIRQKYGLSFDQMKLIELISLEEMIALQMERMLRVFNGKSIFPIHEMLIPSIREAVLRLLNSYPTKKEQKRIKLLLGFTRKPRLILQGKITDMINGSAYSLMK